MQNRIVLLPPPARSSLSLTEFVIRLCQRRPLVDHRVVDTFKSKLNLLYKNQQN